MFCGSGTHLLIRNLRSSSLSCSSEKHVLGLRTFLLFAFCKNGGVNPKRGRFTESNRFIYKIINPMSILIIALLLIRGFMIVHKKTQSHKDGYEKKKEGKQGYEKTKSHLKKRLHKPLGSGR